MQDRPDRRCITCDCKLSSYNRQLQCFACSSRVPLCADERRMLVAEIKNAQSVRRQEKKFLRERRIKERLPIGG